MEKVKKNEGGKMESLSAGADILQLVTFTLGNEEYAVDILKVQEINRMTEIAKVPNSPQYVEGVINLRGRVIPVVSLRRRFALDDKGSDEQSRIMIMEIQGITIGVVVDSVSEVLNIKAGEIEAVPNFGSSLETDYILGMAKTNGGVKILLDIDKVLSREEISALDQAA